jgi:hypothetical protein
MSLSPVMVWRGVGLAAIVLEAPCPLRIRNLAFTSGRKPCASNFLFGALRHMIKKILIGRRGCDFS